MSKYSNEFKVKVVEYYLKHNCSYGDVSRAYNVDKKLIITWIKKYNKHGLLKQKSSYSGEFKESVVKYMHENHLSCREVAIHFNLGSHAAISKWERIYYEEGPQALYEERRGRKKNMSFKSRKSKLAKETEEDLIAENQRLRMENAYLKKLQALVQERTKPKRQKK